ncbi:MAG: hypothetical protein RQ731_05470 [Anaerosomatales bacterium]|nr:hypothetical protein [Anaerosomatales bacterium]MDT8434186.1 hypothetical protein [Anaerosomatales bacterium]
MYERDYILRLIMQVGRMLTAMLHAIREQRPDDALETAREAVAALLDTDIALADAMTGEGLVAFLAAGGRTDVLRSRMLGELLMARADAYAAVGCEGSAMAERARARTVLEAAALEADGEEADRISELLEQLGWEPRRGQDVRW